MEYHSLVQGTPKWLNHRREYFNASDAPAMMAESPYETRTELVRRLATGIEPEITESKQRLFNDGHGAEELCRPIAEKLIGKQLYPVTGSSKKWSASFDGITADETIDWEHKLLNDNLRQAFNSGSIGEDGLLEQVDLPLRYRIQMEHQMAVSGAEKTLFSASRWDNEGNCLEAYHCWYQTDPSLLVKIVKGWTQLAEDAKNYQYIEPKAEPMGKSIESLPALHIELTGMVTASNLDDFRSTAMAVVGAINTDLQTDQDFADAKNAVKYCTEVESKIKAAKEHALSQTASIDKLFSVMDEVSEHFRKTRLNLDKTVKTRNDALKAEIVDGGRDSLKAHITKLNDRLGKQYMPHIEADFPGAIKGRSSFESMRNEVSVVLANAKIEANEIADRIEANLKALREQADGYQSLFPDTTTLVLKEPDDLQAAIKARLADYKDAEEKKLQAARDEAAEAERKRIADAQIEATKEKTQSPPEEKHQSSTVPAQQQTHSDDIVYLLQREAISAPDRYSKLMVRAADVIIEMRRKVASNGT